MAYDGPALEWLQFEPDSNTDVILLRFWDKIKDGNQGKYKAHFYRVQHVDTQEEMMMSPSNTLHEKIMQTGAEIGACVTITRVGKGKQDTRWMAKVVNGNIDQDRADLWEHGDPDPFDPTATPPAPQQQAQPAQQPQAPPPAQPHQNTQSAPPAQPASDPVYNVYTPKPEEHWNLSEVRAAEGARRRRMAFDATVKEFEDVKPEKLTPAQELAWLEQMFNASAGNGVELSKDSFFFWDDPSNRKYVLKEDVPGYQEPEPEPEPEHLVFENDREALAALVADIPTFFEIVAEHDYFKGLSSLSVVGAKKVAKQLGFKLSHLQTRAQKLHVARMVWTFADFMVEDTTKYAEYQSLLKTAKKFDFPEEVIDMSNVPVPPDVQTQTDVEDSLNGDD